MQKIETHLSLEDLTQFCDKLTQMEGSGYTLEQSPSGYSLSRDNQELLSFDSTAAPVYLAQPQQQTMSVDQDWAAYQERHANRPQGGNTARLLAGEDKGMTREEHAEQYDLESKLNQQLNANLKEFKQGFDQLNQEKSAQVQVQAQKDQRSLNEALAKRDNPIQVNRDDVIAKKEATASAEVTQKTLEINVIVNAKQQIEKAHNEIAPPEQHIGAQQATMEAPAEVAAGMGEQEQRAEQAQQATQNASEVGADQIIEKSVFEKFLTDSQYRSKEITFKNADGDKQTVKLVQDDEGKNLYYTNMDNDGNVTSFIQIPGNEQSLESIAKGMKETMPGESVHLIGGKDENRMQALEYFVKEQPDMKIDEKAFEGFKSKQDQEKAKELFEQANKDNRVTSDVDKTAQQEGPRGP
ncbi:MAG: hypothetical protein KDH94_04845 [Coxiellaceae bacterium]|nr:hypothetical protein [Coxiellaceae bacterium]